jgi:DNA repair protein RAD16
MVPSATRRSTRLGEPSTVDDDNDSLSSFPEVSKLGQYVTAGNKKMKGRNSLSSVATSNDNNESSGYSTPATSAFATPSEVFSKSTTTRRGRRTAAMGTDSSTPAVNPVARAAALRNSTFSLTKPNNKRKRVPDSEESEDLDDDEDNSPDAQLARALQEQEVNDSAFDEPLK